MATSIEDINALIGGYTSLKEYYEAQKPRWDGDVVAAQAAYAALAGNLKAIVSAEMTFSATLDPDAVAPNNVDGGIFNDLQLILNTAPASAFVNISVPLGKTVTVAGTVGTKQGQIVFIAGPSSGQNTPADRPTIVFPSYENGAATSHRFIRLAIGANINFQCMRLVAGPLVNTAQFHTNDSCVSPQYGGGMTFSVGLYFCTLEGEDDGATFVATSVGNHVDFATRSCSASGLKLLDLGSNSTARIASYILTLSNNAVLQSGGTQGVNIISA